MKIASDTLIQLTHVLSPGLRPGETVDPLSFYLRPGSDDGAIPPTLNKLLTGPHWEIEANINVGQENYPSPVVEEGFGVSGHVLKAALSAAETWGVPLLSSSTPSELSGVYFAEVDEDIHLVVPGPHTLVSFKIASGIVSLDGVGFLPKGADKILLSFIELTAPDTIEVHVSDSRPTFTAFDLDGNCIWRLSVQNNVSEDLISKDCIISHLSMSSEKAGQLIPSARKWSKTVKSLPSSGYTVSVPEFQGLRISDDYLSQVVKVMGLLRTSKILVMDEMQDAIRFIGVPSDRPGHVPSLETRFVIAPCMG